MTAEQYAALMEKATGARTDLALLRRRRAEAAKLMAALVHRDYCLAWALIWEILETVEKEGVKFQWPGTD